MALVSLLWLASSDRSPEELAGWVTSPGVVYVRATARARRVGSKLPGTGPCWEAASQYVQLTSARLFWQLTLLRLWLEVSPWRGPQGGWLLVLPMLRWLWALAAVLWPGLAFQPGHQALQFGLWRLQQLSVLALGSAIVSTQLGARGEGLDWGLGLALGVLTKQPKGSESAPFA